MRRHSEQRQTNQARDLYAIFAIAKPTPFIFITESPDGYRVSFQPKNGAAWQSRRLKSAFDAEVAADVLAQFLGIEVR